MPPAMMLARNTRTLSSCWNRSTSAWRLSAGVAPGQQDRRIAEVLSRAVCSGSSKHEKTMTFSPCSTAPVTKSIVAPTFAAASFCRAFVSSASSASAQAVARRSSDSGARPLRRRRAGPRPSACRATPVPFGTSTGSHVRSFGGSASTWSFERRSITPCSCTVSSSRFDAPSRLPAVVVLLGRAVALRKREEAAPERVADELQQHEQVARPVRQRRAGQQVHGRLPRRVRRRVFRELPREPAARARVVLQVVRLVEHEPRPRHARRARRCASTGCRS